jgi:hypothetical protein
MAVAAIVTLPFVVPDPRGFWWSLVGFQVSAPFRPDSLSLSALLARLGLHPIPQWFVFMMIVISVDLCLKRAPHSPSGFCAALALVTLVFILFNKQAFCNYYFFCVGALSVTLATTDQYPDGSIFGIVRLPGIPAALHRDPRNGFLCLATLRSDVFVSDNA